ncbi:MAG: hypothetical protein KQH67_12370 [Bacteroidetes bacterium]|nr:hypothetical protein [Bacteroidota bacterium]
MDTGMQLTEKGQRDFELINRILNYGDQSAYDEIRKYYYNTLYIMMLKIIKEPDDAEYLTSAAFEKAYKSLRHYTPIFSFSTWLFKIACNNCIDFMHIKAKDYQFEY